MKYSLRYMTTCSSSYFQGSDLPVVQVLVDENTTYLDIKLSLLVHYLSIDHIEDVDTMAYDEAVHELFSSLTCLDFVPSVLHNVGNMDLEEEWDLYMYFVLETVEEELA